MRSRARASLLVLLGAACGGEDGGADGPDDWVWALPPGVPPPPVPADNRMTRAKVALGRRLFFDVRLSGNQTQACASCHHPERAFSEPRAVSIGSTGERHVRNAPGLANVAYAPTLTWANPVLTSIELHTPIPLFGEHPVEMGALGREAEVRERLASDPELVAEFEAAFPDDSEPVRFPRVIQALAAFQRTLLSFDSPYDRYVRGDPNAMSRAALRGMEAFFSGELQCFRCHGGPDFSTALDDDGTALPERPFHNTGLYDLDGRGAYPVSDPGLFELTGRPEDMGKFRAPSLRNVTVTAPYMHDGSVATLEEVLAIYARGGRLIESGPRAGDGEKSPLKSPLVSGFEMTEADETDLIAFLEALTDPSFLDNPDFGPP